MTVLLTAIAVLLGLILLAAIGCFAQKAWRAGRAKR
jgi:predicted transporter